METMLLLSTATAIIIVIVSVVLLRIRSIVQSIHDNRRKRRQSANDDENEMLSSSSDQLQYNYKDNMTSAPSTVKTVVFLGSGGHTTEMIQLLQHLDAKTYAPVVYIVAESDVTSIPRLQRYISSSSDDDAINRQWDGRYPKSINTSTNNSNNNNDDDTIIQNTNAKVHTLPRAREVHQSYTSSILTTLHSTFKTIQLLWRIQPDLILTNGPGTCVPIIYCAFFLRCWNAILHSIRLFEGNASCSKRAEFKTIFVESVCRVKTLSLSGKLVYPIVDSFVVHWPGLMERYDMAEICDVIVPSLDEG